MEPALSKVPLQVHPQKGHWNSISKIHNDMAQLWRPWCHCLCIHMVIIMRKCCRNPCSILGHLFNTEMYWNGIHPGSSIRTPSASRFPSPSPTINSSEYGVSWHGKSLEKHLICWDRNRTQKLVMLREMSRTLQFGFKNSKDTESNFGQQVDSWGETN